MRWQIDWAEWPSSLLSRRWWPLWLWVIAALVILLTNWFEARVVATVLLLFFLPGWAWLEAWGPKHIGAIWRIVLAAGLAFVLVNLGTLYLAYLPGPLSQGHVLGLCAALTLPPLVIALRRRQLPLCWPDRRLWLLLAIVVTVAAATRLPRLGYAEFHEDEVEVTSLAVRTIKGEDYAVFLHRKGPVQMLVPVSGWLLSGRITEGWTRFPFALASLLGVVTCTFLAYWVAGWPAGITTGLLLALNGYFVAFGRMVQYQVLIFFLVSLAVACLWRLLENGEVVLAWPAMLGLAVSILAHYDAVCFLPVSGYLAWRAWKRWPRARPALMGSSLLAVAILLSFYIPYVLDPQFVHTRTYLLDNRVGTHWFYNNLRTLKRIDADYSSRFYLLVLWALSAVVAIKYRPRVRKWGVVMALALVGMWTTVRWPDLWQVGSLNLSVTPWAIVLVAVGRRMCLHQPDDDLNEGDPGRKRPEKPPAYAAFWIWWGVPLLAYVFLVGDPRTHLYVAYPGWALVGGLGAAVLWRKAGMARPFLYAVGGALALLVLAFQAVIFLPTESALLDLQAKWNGTVGQSLYGRLPKPRSYFGYPRRQGWKAAGWLMTMGFFPDDFRTVGEDFSVPVWYAFDTPRACYDDPLVYLVALPVDGSNDGQNSQLTSQYTHAATVYSEGQPRITLWVRGKRQLAPEDFDLALLEPEYDAIATPDRFVRGSQPAVPLEVQFGEIATLSGFSLSPAWDAVSIPQVAAGDTVWLRLYWNSTAETHTAYRAFVHLGENPVWSQQDDDPACRLPTSLWRVGQHAVGQFRIPISPEIPPAVYPLVVGLYDPVTLERLPVMDARGQPVGDSVTVTTIQVAAVAPEG